MTQKIVECQKCGGQVDATDAGQQFTCPHCGEQVRVTVSIPRALPPLAAQPILSDARIKRNIGREICTALGLFVGLGLLIATVVFPPAFLLGIVILLVASILSRRIYNCSECGSVLVHSRVKICAACHAQFPVKKSFWDFK